jgi:TPP-dependent 2-oxoacid decarboxylase
LLRKKAQILRPEGLTYCPLDGTTSIRTNRLLLVTGLQASQRIIQHRSDHVQAMTGAEAVMNLLSAYEVDRVFGMAGTMTVELYRGIALAGIRHVHCHNEQGASLMADGYARATGKPGVCTIIADPGVTNAVTGIAQACRDSPPMLVLFGACATLTQAHRTATSAADGPKRR